jgi:hypothetical protein
VAGFALPRTVSHLLGTICSIFFNSAMEPGNGGQFDVFGCIIVVILNMAAA